MPPRHRREVAVAQGSGFGRGLFCGVLLVAALAFGLQYFGGVKKGLNQVLTGTYSNLNSKTPPNPKQIYENEPDDDDRSFFQNVFNEVEEVEQSKEEIRREDKLQSQKKIYFPRLTNEEKFKLMNGEASLKTYNKLLTDIAHIKIERTWHAEDTDYLYVVYPLSSDLAKMRQTYEEEKVKRFIKDLVGFINFEVEGKRNTWWFYAIYYPKTLQNDCYFLIQNSVYLLDDISDKQLLDILAPFDPNCRLLQQHQLEDRAIHGKQRLAVQHNYGGNFFVNYFNFIKVYYPGCLKPLDDPEYLFVNNNMFNTCKFLAKFDRNNAQETKDLFKNQIEPLPFYDMKDPRVDFLNLFTNCSIADYKDFESAYGQWSLRLTAQLAQCMGTYECKGWEYARPGQVTLELMIIDDSRFDDTRSKEFYENGMMCTPKSDDAEVRSFRCGGPLLKDRFRGLQRVYRKCSIRMLWDMEANMLKEDGRTDPSEEARELYFLRKNLEHANPEFAEIHKRKASTWISEKGCYRTSYKKAPQGEIPTEHYFKTGEQAEDQEAEEEAEDVVLKPSGISWKEAQKLKERNKNKQTEEPKPKTEKKHKNKDEESESQSAGMRSESQSSNGESKKFSWDDFADSDDEREGFFTETQEQCDSRPDVFPDPERYAGLNEDMTPYAMDKAVKAILSLGKDDQYGSKWTTTVTPLDAGMFKMRELYEAEQDKRDNDLVAFLLFQVQGKLNNWWLLAVYYPPTEDNDCVFLVKNSIFLLEEITDKQIQTALAPFDDCKVVQQHNVGARDRLIVQANYAGNAFTTYNNWLLLQTHGVPLTIENPKEALTESSYFDTYKNLDKSIFSAAFMKRQLRKMFTMNFVEQERETDRFEKPFLTCEIEHFVDFESIYGKWSLKLASELLECLDFTCDTAILSKNGKLALRSFPSGQALRCEKGKTVLECGGKPTDPKATHVYETCGIQMIWDIQGRKVVTYDFEKELFFFRKTLVAANSDFDRVYKKDANNWDGKRQLF